MKLTNNIILIAVLVNLSLAKVGVPIFYREAGIGNIGVHGIVQDYVSDKIYDFFAVE